MGLGARTRGGGGTEEGQLTEINSNDKSIGLNRAARATRADIARGPMHAVGSRRRRRGPEIVGSRTSAGLSLEGSLLLRFWAKKAAFHFGLGGARAWMMGKNLPSSGNCEAEENSGGDARGRQGVTAAASGQARGSGLADRARHRYRTQSRFGSVYCEMRRQIRPSSLFGDRAKSDKCACGVRAATDPGTLRI